MKTPIGRKIRKALRAGHSGPLVRIRSKEIPDAGILRVPRVTNASDGRPALVDGRVLDVANILWCTGMGTDFSWIRLPVFEPDGYPRHNRGRVVTEPGLYFVGLTFQYSLSSGTLVGVGRDAALVSQLDCRTARTIDHDESCGSRSCPRVIGRERRLLSADNAQAPTPNSQFPTRETWRESRHCCWELEVGNK